MTKPIRETNEATAQVVDGEVRVDILVGREGKAATVAIAGTETAPAGASAEVTNEGTAIDAALRFRLPRGDAGPPGPKGEAGEVAGNLDGGFF
jgi:hypothetical protein